MEKLRYRKWYDWDSGGYYLGRKRKECAVRALAVSITFDLLTQKN